MTEEFVEPVCDKCGAPITTGFMAVICPHTDQCEFWPNDEEGAKFIRSMRENKEVE
jgi:hypothetical protein